MQYNKEVNIVSLHRSTLSSPEGRQTFVSGQQVYRIHCKAATLLLETFFVVIKTDTHHFIEAFKQKKQDEDEDYPLVFEAMGTAPYLNYLFVPPHQKFASQLTEPDMNTWGVHFQMGIP